MGLVQERGIAVLQLAQAAKQSAGNSQGGMCCFPALSGIVTLVAMYACLHVHPPPHRSLIPDLPVPPPPPLNPATRQPLTADDLAPIFPKGLIEQEVGATRRGGAGRQCGWPGWGRSTQVHREQLGSVCEVRKGASCLSRPPLRLVPATTPAGQPGALHRHPPGDSGRLQAVAVRALAHVTLGRF